jgi:hypothetical protein
LRQPAQATAEPVACPGEAGADVARTDSRSLRDLSIVVTIEMQVEHLSQLSWERVDGVSEASTDHHSSDALLGARIAVLGVHLIYLRDRFAPGTPASNEAAFHDWAVRGVWIAVFLLGFTVIELEKQFSLFHMGTHLVAGEDPLVNHIAHIISALLAWKLAGALAMTDS